MKCIALTLMLSGCLSTMERDVPASVSPQMHYVDTSTMCQRQMKILKDTQERCKVYQATCHGSAQIKEKLISGGACDMTLKCEDQERRDSLAFKTCMEDN